MSVLFKPDLDDSMLQELFESDDRCYEFLAGIKWEHGFTCRKCGNTNSCAGRNPHSRRCTRCKTEESAAAGTIFHNCKFPISKAFYIACKVCRGEEDISSYEFARRLSLRQMTCWNFKTRITKALEAMDSLTDTEKSSISKILT